MKDISLKYGNTKVGINKEYILKFKSEGEFIEAMKGKVTDIAEPKRTEMLKGAYADAQPKAEPATPAKTETKKG